MTEFWKDEPDIAEGLDAAAVLIQKGIAGANSYIASYLNQMASVRGKMLRPALILIGARFGKKNDPALVYEQAALIEMIHIASLIHDDIIDSAPTRRGIPTLYRELGARRAVIAGDYVLARALALGSSQFRGDEPAAAVSRAFCRLCDGEISQDSEEWDFTISESHYLRRIGGKTASLFALSGYMGANHSDAEPAIQNLLHQIGYTLGMSFQIKDDILDMNGSQDSLGKPVYRDLRSGVCTLPLIYAIEQDKTGRLAATLSGRRSISAAKAGRLIRRIKELGGIERAESTASAYSDRASELINRLPDKETVALLQRMMNKLHLRDH